MSSRGVTDHITPWKGVYKTAQILGEGTTFVLSNKAAICRACLNPPTNPKGVLRDRICQSGGGPMLSSPPPRSGRESWWLRLGADWLQARSGEEVAPTCNRLPAANVIPSLRKPRGLTSLIDSTTSGDRASGEISRSPRTGCGSREAGRHRGTASLDRRAIAPGRDKGMVLAVSLPLLMFNGIGGELGTGKTLP